MIFYVLFYSRPAQPYRIYNTWLGDPGKLFLLEAFLDVLKQQNLLDQVNSVGAKLKSGLHDYEKEYPSLLNSVRGRGTFLAVNASTTALRDKLVGNLKKKGKCSFQSSTSGPRPS